MPACPKPLLHALAGLMALAAPAVAQDAPAQDPAALMAARDRGNLGDWRGMQFHCVTDDNPVPFALGLCAALRDHARAAAAEANIALTLEADPFRFGVHGGRGLPALVAYIHTTRARPEEGIALHVSLRAEQAFAGPVGTRDTPDAEAAREMPRNGTLVLWERTATGFQFGPDALARTGPALAPLVHAFFATLRAARQ